MSAYIQFRMECNGPGQEGLAHCAGWLIVSADNVTTARRYAFEQDKWISVQEGNTVQDYCPDCDPTKLEPDLYLRLRTGRSTHRLAVNAPASERKRAQEKRDGTTPAATPAPTGQGLRG